MPALPANTQAASTNWSLLGICAEGQPPRKFNVWNGQIIVGRWEDVDLRLSFRGVSKHHAAICVDHGRLAVTDLGSTNGTFVNGHRIVAETSLQAGDVVQFGNVAFQVTCERSAEAENTQAELVVDHATTLLQFDRLMSKCAVTPYFQPVVCMSLQAIVGFEVLARSRVVGLESAQALFGAAAMVQQEVELSQLCRDAGTRKSARLYSAAELFLNTHPTELEDERLVPSLEELRSEYPLTPLTLEIHEATVTDTEQIRKLRGQLKSLDIKLAYDDFGAGQARMIELVNVPPDYLKFDRKLIQDIHIAPAQRQQMLATLVRMVRDLGIAPLAEGVELPEEGKVCKEMGFTHGQGFLYGKPSSVKNWSQ